jgi:guanosine-3',5'-bis(diphosphate) 3'-pyrophosphohydrolase
VKILVDSGVSDGTTLAAAALHDTIEDTKTTFEELVSNFGVAVAKVVQECSDDKKLPKAERKKLQIEKAKTVSKEARLVKMADKLSNLSGLQSDPPKDWTPEYIKGYALWSHMVVSSMNGDPDDANYTRLQLTVLQVAKNIVDGDKNITLESFLELCK